MSISARVSQSGRLKNDNSWGILNSCNKNPIIVIGTTVRHNWPLIQTIKCVTSLADSPTVSGGDRCPGGRAGAWVCLSRREASCISAPSRCRDGLATRRWRTSAGPSKRNVNKNSHDAKNIHFYCFLGGRRVSPRSAAVTGLGRGQEKNNFPRTFLIQITNWKLENRLVCLGEPLVRGAGGNQACPASCCHRGGAGVRDQ